MVEEESTKLYLSEIQMKARELEHKYSLVKEQLYYSVQRYFNQSIAGNYTTEQTIHNLLDECCKIKEEYNMYKQEILKISRNESINRFIRFNM